MLRLCSVQCEVEPFMQSHCRNTKTWLGTLIWEWKISCVRACWHCRHVFLFRNIYTWPRPRAF